MANAERLLAEIQWAYELLERAAWLKGHAARAALLHAASQINQRFKQYSNDKVSRDAADAARHDAARPQG